MKTAMLLFPGFTALDAIGPYHAIAALPGWEFSFVAERAGPVSNGGSFTMEAQVGIDEIGQPDLLVVPGGVAAIALAREGHALVDWIRDVHPGTTWTTSVCTGALMLGAAGVLQGLRATTQHVAHPRRADRGRSVRDGRSARHGVRPCATLRQRASAERPGGRVRLVEGHVRRHARCRRARLTARMPQRSVSADADEVVGREEGVAELGAQAVEG